MYMQCLSIKDSPRIELFYFVYNFHCIALWVSALSLEIAYNCRELLKFIEYRWTHCAMQQGLADRLDNLHKRTVKLIDNKAHRDQDIAQLISTYGQESLLKRREKHHLSLMYRLKDDKDLIEQYRANIELTNNSKIKFKTRITKVANSPYYRGVQLWDRLNGSTQKATTKVKFKQLIA